MHRNDLVVYARLVETFNQFFPNTGFQLLVTENIYNISYVNNFLCDYFPNYIVVPDVKGKKLDILSIIFSSFRLRRFLLSLRTYKSTLIITDKSKPESRLMLKRFSNVILIQQIEEICNQYKFDFLYTLLDAIYCLILGSYYAKWYVLPISGGLIRALKVCSQQPNVLTIYQVLDSLVANHFSLPPVKKSSTRKKIVIFGSRFFSWPYFISANSKQNFQILSNIYAYIHSEFRSYDAFYVPHPLENGREFTFIDDIFCGNLSVADQYFSSEHFLLQNRDIEYTFSLGSTSSFSSFSMGFSSKVFYKMFDLPEPVQSTYNNIFKGLPSEFFLDNLSYLLNPCIRKQTCSDLELISPLLNASQLSNLKHHKINYPG